MRSITMRGTRKTLASLLAALLLCAAPCLAGEALGQDMIHSWLADYPEDGLYWTCALSGDGLLVEVPYDPDVLGELEPDERVFLFRGARAGTVLITYSLMDASDPTGLPVRERLEEYRVMPDLSLRELATAWKDHRPTGVGERLLVITRPNLLDGTAYVSDWAYAQTGTGLLEALTPDQAQALADLEGDAGDEDDTYAYPPSSSPAFTTFFFRGARPGTVDLRLTDTIDGQTDSVCGYILLVYEDLTVETVGVAYR